MTPQEFFKGMREHFKIEDPSEFYDEYFLINKEVKIDLLAFIDWFEANDDTKIYSMDKSIRDVVTEKFGKEASNFLERLL